MCECDVTVSLMCDLKVIENGETVFYRRLLYWNRPRKWSSYILHSNQTSSRGMERDHSKNGASDSSRLCWRHFDEDDILKGKFILGQFHPQQRWRLKDGAAPKHLLGNNVHYNCFTLQSV